MYICCTNGGNCKYTLYIVVYGGIRNYLVEGIKKNRSNRVLARARTSHFERTRQH